MNDGNKWSDAEMDIIKRTAERMQTAGVQLTQRGLARVVRIDGRSQAAVYVKIREMMSAGKGWWSNKGIGRQITV